MEGEFAAWYGNPVYIVLKEPIEEVVTHPEKRKMNSDTYHVKNVVVSRTKFYRIHAEELVKDSDQFLFLKNSLLHGEYEKSVSANESDTTSASDVAIPKKSIDLIINQSED